MSPAAYVHHILVVWISFSKIPQEEDERDRLPVTAGMQEAKIPSLQPVLMGKTNCCSVSFWNVVTTNYWKKDLGNIKLKIKI